MATKLTAQAQRSREKKRHIYETAMAMFRRQGYGPTTIRDICKEAAISNSTFYHFFGDKSGVLAEFYRDLLATRSDYLAPSPENLSHPFQSVFNYYLHASAAQDLMGREFARETLIADPSLLTGDRDPGSHYSSMQQIALFLSAAAKAGTVPPELDPWQTAEYIVTGASGILFNWLHYSEKESAQALMCRLLPKILSAVSDEKIDSDISIQPDT